MGLNLVCQLRADEQGLVVKVWEVPAAYEVIPDEAWLEQSTPPSAVLGALAGPAVVPARAR